MSCANPNDVVSSMTVQAIGNATQLTDQLRQAYAYPEPLERPWLRLNFVTSIDGAVTMDGTSGGLGTDLDHRVFALLRELADVVLVGAGTVRAENYGGARPDAAQRARRTARGQAPVPVVAVVTAR
ncbi:MAG: hypothetical protein HOQ24_04405, partial [Mycobacteriaceae bacterium]|nr:hypothetical protein [Mycobacteriaceae bacterium]